MGELVRPTLAVFGPWHGLGRKTAGGSGAFTAAALLFHLGFFDFSGCQLSAITHVPCWCTSLLSPISVATDISINMGIVIGYLVAFGVAATVEGDSECSSLTEGCRVLRPRLLHCSVTPPQSCLRLSPQSRCRRGM